MKLAKYLSIILFSISSIVPSEIIADTKKEISICAKKNNATDKLICYDNIAYQLGVLDFDQSKKQGKWQRTQSKSKQKNRNNVMLSLPANAIIRVSNNDTIPALKIRCINNHTDVLINWNAFISPYAKGVTIRFDEMDPETALWWVSTDYTGTFPHPYNYIRFINRMMNHATMAATVTTYDGRQLNASFDLIGLRNNINLLRESCDW